MVIDLLERNTVNVKDLALERPKQSRVPEPIDINQLLTDEDKRNLVDHYKVKDSLRRKGLYAVYIAILYPDKLKSLDSLDSRWGDSVWREFSKEWMDFRKLRTNWYGFARTTRELMILFPQKTDKMIKDNPLKADEMERIKTQFNSSKGGRKWYLEGGEDQVVEIAASLKILAPNYLTNTPYTSSEWDEMVSSFALQVQRNNTFFFFTQAINMKIVSTGTNLKVNLPPQTQQLIQQYLLERKSHTQSNPDNWGSVAEIAAGLKILTAGNVELTNQGLKLGSAEAVKPEVGLNTAPALPTTRKF